MQLELTVRDAGGAERDVRVTAPADTPFRRIAEQLRRDFPEADQRLWTEIATVAARGRVRRPGPADRRHDRARCTGTDLGQLARSCDPTEAVMRLHVVGGPEAGRIEALPAGETVIGRSTESDLVVRDPRMSRRHAAVSVTVTGIHVRDLGSTNGTRLDGVAVDRHGCELRPDAPPADRRFDARAWRRRPTADGRPRPGPDGTVLLQPGHRPVAADDRIDAGRAGRDRIGSGLSARRC